MSFIVEHPNFPSIFIHTYEITQKTLTLKIYLEDDVSLVESLQKLKLVHGQVVTIKFLNVAGHQTDYIPIITNGIVDYNVSGDWNLSKQPQIISVTYGRV